MYKALCNNGSVDIPHTEGYIRLNTFLSCSEMSSAYSLFDSPYTSDVIDIIDYITSNIYGDVNRDFLYHVPYNTLLLGIYGQYNGSIHVNPVVQRSSSITN